MQKPQSVVQTVYRQMDFLVFLHLQTTNNKR